MRAIAKITGKSLLALVLLIFVTLGAVACADGSEGNENGNGADSSIYYIEYNGIKIELGAEADAVLSALGEANSKKEIGDCGGLGAQVRYDYSSFILYVLESNDGNVIDQITLINDLTQTAKGICIGSEEAAVHAAYGEPQSADGNRLKYIDGKKQLVFEIENEKVKGIDLMCVTQ